MLGNGPSGSESVLRNEIGGGPPPALKGVTGEWGKPVAKVTFLPLEFGELFGTPALIEGRR